MDRLERMEAFVRVVDAGSFSAAARTWGRSKAAVSKYVRQLEAHLGIPLLVRTTRALRLTDAGRTYYDECAGLIAQVEAVEASVRGEHLSPTGRLRVTTTPSFATQNLRAITHDFLEEYPGITLDLVLTHRMVDLVAESIDVAIRVTEPDDSSLVARKIAPNPVVTIASPAYLEEHGEPTTVEELADHPCIVDTNFRDQHRWRFEVNGERKIVSVHGPVRANSPNVVRTLVVQGMGIGMCAHSVVEADLKAGRLQRILTHAAGPQWSIYAVYPRRRYLSKRVRLFVDHLAEKFGAATAE